jgi:hypothetical protein
MNTSIKAILLTAAGAGLMSGSAQAQPVSPSSTVQGRTLAAADLGQSVPGLGQAPAKHACKGLNSCKGQGGCATGDMGCKGKNTCKGRGGCKTDM